LGGFSPFGGVDITRNNLPDMRPMVISTWKFGMEANRSAWKILFDNGSSMDAVSMQENHQPIDSGYEL